MQVGKQAGRQTGRQAGRQASRQARSFRAGDSDQMLIKYVFGMTSPKLPRLY